MPTERLIHRLVLGLCLVACLVSGRARAEGPADEARAHFERGVAHADRGEVDAAIVAFEAAYAASPHPAVLFNLGHAYSVAGRSLDAVRAVRSFLEQASPTPQRRHEAEHLLRFNEARIGRLTFVIEPADAVLSLDGRLLGLASELSSVEVQAGAHVLRAEAPGHRAREQPLSVEPWVSREQRIALTLEPAPFAPPGETLTAPAPLVVRPPVDVASARGVDALARVAERRRMAAYVTGGAALAAGISAATLYVFIGRRRDSWYDTSWSPTDSDDDAMVDEARDMQRVEDVAAGCVIASGALAVSAVTLWLVSRRATPGSPSRNALASFPSYRW
jgi:hypothetical protein